MHAMARIGANAEDSDTIARYYAEISGLDEQWCVDTLRIERGKHLEYIERKKKLKKLRKKSS